MPISFIPPLKPIFFLVKEDVKLERIGLKQSRAILLGSPFYVTPFKLYMFRVFSGIYLL